MSVPLTDALRQQYQALFDGCVVNPAQMAAVNHLATSIAQNQGHYQSVAGPLGIPWYFVALIHNMECSLNFRSHLHNGDPLSARTVHVPAGRPVSGQPPFTWEQSATDALTYQGFANHSDWSLPALLYRLEAYNGFGSRNHGINTPYLWSSSNHYTRGKYVADGVFDPNAVSTQIGGAVILFQMRQNGIVSFAPAARAAAAASGGTVSTAASVATGAQLAAEFDNTVTFAQTSDAARSLQTMLNKFPGISLPVDGNPGRQTSDAYQKVTGHFLKGDPLR